MTSMNLPLPKAMIALIAMLLAAWLSVVLRPTEKIADKNSPVRLESLLPDTFGDWHLDQTVKPLVLNPQQMQLLARIYSQTLARTYVDSQGQRIMVSIAYGSDQSDAMKVHKPEICYAAQGFQINEQHLDTINIDGGALPVKRVFAQQGNRYEPITYWVTVGDRIARPDMDQKLIQLAYGLAGKIPDGMLVRLSSIDQDTTHAYRMQDAFLRQLLSSMPQESRHRLVGSLG